jgi:hypothetical protein
LVARSIPPNSTARPVSYTRDLKDTNRRCYETASFNDSDYLESPRHADGYVRLCAI